MVEKFKSKVEMSLKDYNNLMDEKRNEHQTFSDFYKRYELLKESCIELEVRYDTESSLVYQYMVPKKVSEIEVIESLIEANKKLHAKCLKLEEFEHISKDLENNWFYNLISKL